MDVSKGEKDKISLELTGFNVNGDAKDFNKYNNVMCRLFYSRPEQKHSDLSLNLNFVEYGGSHLWHHLV